MDYVQIFELGFDKYLYALPLDFYKCSIDDRKSIEQGYEVAGLQQASRR